MKQRTLLRTSLASLALAAACIALPLDTFGWFDGNAAFQGTYINGQVSPFWAPAPNWQSGLIFGQPPAIVNGFGGSHTLAPIQAENSRWATLLLNANGMVIGCGSNHVNQLQTIPPTGVGTMGPVILRSQSPNQPLSEIIQIASGRAGEGSLNYALTVRGNVYRWGQVAVGNTAVPVPMDMIAGAGPFDRVKQIAADSGNVFMLRSDGTVWLFGDPSYAGYNVSGSGNQPRPLLLANNTPVSNIKQVAAGSTHVVLLDAKGKVWGLGRMDSGQFGGPSSAQSQPTPKAVMRTQSQALDRIKEVVATASASFFLRADGTVWGIGEAELGLMGVGPATFSTVNANGTRYSQYARQIPGLKFIRHIWGSQHTMYALQADGKVLTWGNGQWAARGYVGQNGLTPNFVDLNPSQPWKAEGIVSGAGSLMLRSTGTGHYWGLNAPTGSASTGVQGAPTPLVLPASLGQYRPHTYVMDRLHTSAINFDGKVLTAGEGFAQGNTQPNLGRPIQNPGVYGFGATNLSRAIDLDAQWGTTVVLDAQGLLRGFGANPLAAPTPSFSASNDVIGLTSTMPGVIDVDIAQGRGPNMVPVTLLALTSDGRVWTRGSNRGGMLGINSSNQTQNSTQWSVVRMKNNAPLENVIAIDGGLTHCMALCADGSVYTWGANRDGQLGLGVPVTQANITSPVAQKAILPGGDRVKSISAGSVYPGNWSLVSGYSLFLLDDGRMLSCGSNRYRTLGHQNVVQGDNLPHPNPNLIPAVGPAGPVPRMKAIRAGFHSSAALSAEGNVYVWGDGSAGQFGNGGANVQAPGIPTLVPSNEPFWKLNAGSVSPGTIGVSAR